MIKYLPELLKENIISQEIADRINEYYQNKQDNGKGRLILVFGILGALLIGLGIILIIAYNWDKFPKTSKLIFSFIPLVVGQLLCALALWKKKDSTVWKESSTTFLFLAIGACISLVTQIYHISLSFNYLIMLWMILVLPTIYLMKSSFSSLLYIIGITYYSCLTGYWSYPNPETHYYWILLALIIPHYLLLVKNNSNSNFVYFHNLIIPLSLIISLGTLSHNNYQLMYIAYYSLFGILLNLGNIRFFQKKNTRVHLFSIIGFAGTIYLLFWFSFKYLWNYLAKTPQNIYQLFLSQEMLIAVFLTAIGLILLIKKIKTHGFNLNNPIEYIFVLFIAMFILGCYLPLAAVIFVNAIIMFLAVTSIVNGIKSDRLSILNLGLIILTILIICRFFDTNMSFLTRGFLFILVGLGFFISNYEMLKNRRKNEK